MTTETMNDNPLLHPGPARTACRRSPQVRAEHFAPAFEVAMREHRAEIDAIARRAEPPTFDNTVAALDRSGRLLRPGRRRCSTT